jgi:DNA-nicking Smr family endonuclease
MSRRRHLSDEEHALWTGFARSITPLRGSKKAAGSAADADEDAPAPVKPADAKPPGAKPPGAVSRDAAPRAKPPAKTPPLAPLGRRLKKRVARGREPIEARLDLHGKTQSEAHTALLRFLKRAQADGLKTALVVTGKGTNKSEGEPWQERGVLKRQVPLWLALPEFRALIIGFEDAHVGHGGQGALYVRLRRP